MDSPTHGLTAPPSIFELGGRRFEAASPDFAEAIAEAHAAHLRPHCRCLVEGVEMYVARLGDGYIIKRMPNTGSQHSPDCPSYKPPAEFSGLGQVLGSAISEDPATGETTLTLNFPLSKFPGRSTAPSAGGESDSAATDGTKLTLRGLLHYLWDQAELTRWQPGFAGKRSWATVRKHLFQAAKSKIARGDSLRSRLYIPEVFSVADRDEINARRWAHWSRVIAAPGKPQHLMLLIAEVKEIVPARYGFKAVVKHVPDQAFALDEQLYRRLERRFVSELALWSAAEDIRMVMIGTFSLAVAGTPTIEEMSLMPVTRNWLPVEDEFERRLIHQLVADGRSFLKGLRYNLGSGRSMVCATLTDCEESAPLLLVVQRGSAEGGWHLQGITPSAPVWLWNPSCQTMPSLPSRRSHDKYADNTSVHL